MDLQREPAWQHLNSRVIAATVIEALLKHHHIGPSGSRNFYSSKIIPTASVTGVQWHGCSTPPALITIVILYI